MTTLRKRLKNLWTLSGYEVELEMPKGTIFPEGSKISMIVKTPNKMAQIIHRETEVEKFLKKNKDGS